MTKQKIINMTSGMYDIPVIEDNPDETSFFYDVYKKAWKNLIYIENHKSDINKSMDASVFNNKFDIDSHNGNHILFTSDRGQGKTSALLSFVSQMTKADTNSPHSSLSEGSKCRYYFLNSIIDPSTFQKGETLTRVFLSKIIDQYNDEYNKIRKTHTLYAEKNLSNDNEAFLKQMNLCFMDLETIKEAGKNITPGLDNIDKLATLGDSQNLKKDIHELVDRYLRIVNNIDDNTDSDIDFLVVCIDDADLSMNQTYEICEDIKNYLSAGNIILLISANLDQMEDSVMQKYISSYNTLLKHTDHDRDEIVDNCRRLANKYLSKIFPLEERIYLPVVSNLSGSGQIDYIVKFHDISNKEKNENELASCSNIQEQLSRLIYNRTGIILAKKSENDNEFLPSSLRDMAYLINLLYDMTPLDYLNDVVRTWESAGSGKSDEKISKIQSNINKLESYYRHVWAPSVLDDTSNSIMKKIYNTKHKNWEDDIVTILKDHNYFNYDGETNGINNTYRYIRDEVIPYMEQNRSDSLLVSAIKLHLTFYLHKKIYENWGDKDSLSKLGYYIQTSFSRSSSIYNALWNDKIRVFTTYCLFDDIKMYFPDGKLPVFENNKSPYLNHLIKKSNGDVEFDIYNNFVKTFMNIDVIKNHKENEEENINNDKNPTDLLNIMENEGQSGEIQVPRNNYGVLFDSMVILLNPIFQDELMDILYKEEYENIPSFNDAKSVSPICDTWIEKLIDYCNKLLSSLEIKISMPESLSSYEAESGTYISLVLLDKNNIDLLKENLYNWKYNTNNKLEKLCKKIKIMSNTDNMKKTIDSFMDDVNIRRTIDNYMYYIESMTADTIWDKLYSDDCTWEPARNAFALYKSLENMQSSVIEAIDNRKDSEDIIKIFNETTIDILQTGVDAANETIDS